MVDSPALIAAIAVLRRHRSRAGVFVDFDGTLAPIVDRPPDARPTAGVVDVLVNLGEQFAVVAVISGRPVDFLQRHLPDSLVLSGLYGLETMDHGVRRVDPRGEQWRHVIDAVAAAAIAEGLRAEPKGMTVALHFREDPAREPAVRTFAAEQAARTGLVISDARMAVELRPPVEVDKGAALLDLGHDLEVVVFAGDDQADVAAFEALDVLAARGVRTFKIAVRSDESPPELLDRADFVLDGPAGVLEFFSALAGDS